MCSAVDGGRGTSPDDWVGNFWMKVKQIPRKVNECCVSKLQQDSHEYAKDVVERFAEESTSDGYEA